MSDRLSFLRLSVREETGVNTNLGNAEWLRGALNRNAAVPGGWGRRAAGWLAAVVLSVCLAAGGRAGTIQFSDVRAYVHEGGGLAGTLDSSSAGYFETLDGDGFGSFGWVYANTGAVPLTDLKFIVFLDADIDRDDNTFFNEYGEFVSLDLPPGAPVGSIAASDWEIDEPGFLFGDILSNAFAGFLDNSNAIDSALPDDVSLALLFQVGALDPGLAATITLQISPTNINGLRQLDPDSDLSFYFNGFAAVDEAPPTGGEIPEPGTWSLIAGGLGVAAWLRRRRSMQPRDSGQGAVIG
jgi:hypothetical protein